MAKASARRYRTLETAVLCEHHGEVHAPESDVYQCGDTDCRPANWRPIAALGTAEEIGGY